VVLFVISLVIALLYQKFVLNRDLEGAITDEKSMKKAARKAAKAAARSAQ
jgi:raffinose/stachyose/melibiose transport system permease protein